MNTKNEVVIIGAGSTGLAAAIFLTERGFPLRIFEKRERVSITKALGINPVTLQIFEQSGITRRLMDNGWRLDSSVFWYKDKRLYQNNFGAVKHQYPFVVIQPQSETETILENYLNEKGIFVERCFDLQNLTGTANGTQLRFQNVATGQLLNLETEQVVVGADGGRSRVRELTGVRMEGWEHPDEYVLYDIELDTPLANNQLHYIFHPEGAMLMLHIRDGVWRVGGSLPNPLDHLPKGTRTGKITWETRFQIREQVARRFNTGNVFLLGDAAHLHSPVGGKGMNMCIEDGYIFADQLAQNSPQVYAQARRHKLRKDIGALGQLTELTAGQHVVGQTLRRQMPAFSFLFPVFMPYVRKFLLGLT